MCLRESGRTDFQIYYGPYVYECTDYEPTLKENAYSNLRSLLNEGSFTETLTITDITDTKLTASTSDGMKIVVTRGLNRIYNDKIFWRWKLDRQGNK